jgi:hyperpolarization activated cyclic nucleotide-gated potassium channel 2
MKLQQIEEYMQWRRFPLELRKRITSYYEHRYQGKMFDEQSILNDLSEHLRSDILNYNCRNLVSSVPLFANADKNVINLILIFFKSSFSSFFKIIAYLIKFYKVIILFESLK